MTVVFDLLLVLHFIGWAVVLGAWFVGLRARRVNSGVLHGALTALVCGTAAWLITLPGWVDGYGGEPLELSAPKMAIKLTITLAVVLLAWIATRTGTAQHATPTALGPAGGPALDGPAASGTTGGASTVDLLPPRWAAPAMGVLVIVNIVIAVFWH